MNEKLNGTAAHPGFTKVKLKGGEIEGKIRPWTMAKRAELKPALGAIIARVEDLRGDEGFSFPKLLMEAEEELIQIAQVSVELPEGVTFDELLWEDLPNLVQAIWETNIITEAGGGLGGKLVSLLKPLLQVGLDGLAKNIQEPDLSLSSTKIEPAPSSLGSPS